MVPIIPVVTCVLPSFIWRAIPTSASRAYPVTSSVKRILAGLMFLCACESPRSTSVQGCNKIMRIRTCARSEVWWAWMNGGSARHAALHTPLPRAVATQNVSSFPRPLRHLQGSLLASTGTPGKVAVHRRRGPAQDARGGTCKEPVSNIHRYGALVVAFRTCSSRKKCFCTCGLGERRLTATRRPCMVPRYTHPEPPRPTILDALKWFVAASISEEETA
jgi:hypothetical protein